MSGLTAICGDGQDTRRRRGSGKHGEALRPEGLLLPQGEEAGAARPLRVQDRRDPPAPPAARRRATPCSTSAPRRAGSCRSSRRRWGERGVAVGVDLEPIRNLGKPWVKTAVVDLLAPDALEQIRALHPGRFQLVTSDMAPKTIGIRSPTRRARSSSCRMALGVAEETLAPGGAFVAKVFMGGDFPALKKELAARFDEVRRRPAAGDARVTATRSTCSARASPSGRSAKVLPPMATLIEELSRARPRARLDARPRGAARGRAHHRLRRVRPDRRLAPRRPPLAGDGARLAPARRRHAHHPRRRRHRHGRRPERQAHRAADPLGRARSTTTSPRIRAQLERFVSFEGANAARVRNNADWLRPLGLMEFLRDAGKHFTVNYMLAKDSVKNRMETGISFTEFSYMLIQAYDFWHLWKTERCELQMGGSRPVGQHHRGHRAHLAQGGGERARPHAAAPHHRVRREVRQDRGRRGLARSREDRRRTSSSSSG